MDFLKILHIIRLSFYSKEFYRDVYYNLKGFKFLYIILFAAVVNLTFILPVYNLFNKLMNSPSPSDSEVAHVISQLPVMYLKEGRLSTNDAEPMFIQSLSGEKVVVIDTKSPVSKYTKSQIPIFINQDGIFMLIDRYGTYTQSLSFKNFFESDVIISKDFIDNVFEAMREKLFLLSFFVFYPITVVAKSFFIAVNIGIFALLGLLYSRFKAFNLEFKSLCRIGVFSAFPPLVVDAAINLSIYATKPVVSDTIHQITNSPLKANVVFVLSIFYYYFALQSCITKK